MNKCLASLAKLARIVTDKNASLQACRIFLTCFWGLADAKFHLATLKFKKGYFDEKTIRKEKE